MTSYLGSKGLCHFMDGLKSRRVAGTGATVKLKGTDLRYGISWNKNSFLFQINCVSGAIMCHFFNFLLRIFGLSIRIEKSKNLMSLKTPSLLPPLRNKNMVPFAIIHSLALLEKIKIITISFFFKRINKSGFPAAGL